jgi:hypothetical protein
MRIRFMLLFAMGLLLVPTAARATSCTVTPDLEAALTIAPVAFVGEVTAISDLDRVAEMRVVAVWKGPDLPTQVTVRGALEEGLPVTADDARFTVGVRYLVVPENAQQPFQATRCSATTPIRATGTVIPAAYHEAVGAQSGRLPIAQSQSGTSSAMPDGNLVLGLAAAGVTASALGVLATRRRSGRRNPMTEGAPKRGRRNRSPAFKTRRFSTTGLGSRLFSRSGMQHTMRNKKKY